MDDLISRAAALEAIDAVKGIVWSQSGKVLCGKMYSQTKDLPAVDAVPVIRCRDCKFYYGVNEECGCNGGYHSESWYCADGERRDGDD